MIDIMSFLNARLEEDKAAAVRAAEARAGDLTAGSPWHAMGSLLLATQADGVADCIAEIVNYQLDDVLEHIARHDPARVLREVEAKRRILARHRPRDPDWMASQRAWHDRYAGELPFEPKPPPCAGCGTCGSGGRRGDAYVSRSRTPDFTKCPELIDLALSYADHPDYDPIWDLASG